MIISLLWAFCVHLLFRSCSSCHLKINLSHDAPDGLENFLYFISGFGSLIASKNALKLCEAFSVSSKQFSPCKFCNPIKSEPLARSINSSLVDVINGRQKQNG